jgi:hypothetical protein
MTQANESAGKEGMAQATAVQLQMRAAANGVLDMMFMSPVVEDVEFPPPHWVDPIIVGLDFTGRETRGICALALEEATARNLANIFLCFENGEELSRLSAWDVMCELSNMLCGAFLGHYDKQDSYKLSSPRSLLPGEFGPGQPLHRSILQTKHGGLLFILAFDSEKSA